jgi:pantoate kinase
VRRLRAITVLAALTVVVFLLACSPAELLGRTSVGQYVSAVRAPLGELTTWAQDVLAFYGEVLQLRQINGTCSTGRLDELITRGERIVGQLRQINAPSALASVHSGIADTGDKTLGNLRQVRELLCERQDLAQAQAFVERAQDTLRDLSELLNSLRERIPEL